MKPPIPILRIFDETKAKEFYMTYLGFKIDWEHRFSEGTPLYMQVSKGECVIHLSEHYGDGSAGSCVRIETPGLDDYLDQLRAKRYKYLNPGTAEMQPWGLREITLPDWEAKKASMQSPFIANPALPNSKSETFALPPNTNISFYGGTNMQDLRWSYGAASIEGSVVFGLVRDSSNPKKIILSSVSIDAVVKNIYAFDWTRASGTSYSHEAATLQIGWQPPSRKGGKVFSTETEVKQVFTTVGGAWF